MAMAVLPSLYLDFLSAPVPESDTQLPPLWKVVDGLKLPKNEVFEQVITPELSRPRLAQLATHRLPAPGHKLPEMVVLHPPHSIGAYDLSMGMLLDMALPMSAPASHSASLLGLRVALVGAAAPRGALLLPQMPQHMPPYNMPPRDGHMMYHHPVEMQYLPYVAVAPAAGAAAKGAPVHTIPALRSRKYHCKVCNKQFTTSGHLARHSRIHTGERRHKCPFEGCSARFSRHDNCMQHYKTHMGKRRVKRSGLDDEGLMPPMSG